jgi:hypothetical protein
LGISHTELAKMLELSMVAIGFFVERGEAIAKEDKYLFKN